MSQGSELDRLERFVSKLMGQYSQLKKAYGELEDKLSQKEEKIKSLEQKLGFASLERDDISGRVKKIITQIEEWETIMEDSSESEDEEEAEDDFTSVNEEVVEETFSDDTDPDKNAESYQQNLF